MIEVFGWSMSMHRRTSLHWMNITFPTSSLFSIINRAKEIPQRMYLFICAEDFSSTDLLTNEFEKCFTFIDRALEQGHRVLIHCHAGLSRSATIAAMRSMRKYSLTRDQAIERIKGKRTHSTVTINEGFLHQLDLFHRMNYRVDQQNELFREFQPARFEKKENPSTPTEATILLWNDQQRQDYRCRECQRNLFSNTDVQRHERQQNVICDDRKRLWTFYFDWIEEIFEQPIGSIPCPTCRCLLGEYSLQGLWRSCDQRLKPAFVFQCQTIEGTDASVWWLRVSIAAHLALLKQRSMKMIVFLQINVMQSSLNERTNERTE